jgi:hypothetical protein
MSASADTKAAQLQRDVSILCRFPTFQLPPDEEDEDSLIEQKERCISPLTKVALTMVVRWEISALRRTGGYNVLENNLHMEGASRTDGPGKDKPDAQQSLEESSYEYVPPFSALIFRGFCPHHSTSRRLHFVRTVQSLAKAIEQIIASFTKEFDKTQMGNFSYNRKLGLGHEITLTYGTIHKVRVCLERGIPFESKDGKDEPLDCPGTHPRLPCTLTPSQGAESVPASPQSKRFKHL